MERTFPYSLSYKQIAMIVIGRRIRREECVHHIDGDHSNNDPDNLLVVRTVDHYRIHHTQVGPKWLAHAFDWLAPPAPPKTYVSASKMRPVVCRLDAPCEDVAPSLEIILPDESPPAKPTVIEQLPDSRRFWKSQGYL